MKNLIKKILRENDWDFLDDVDPSLGDELNYLLDGSNYYLSVSRQVTLGGSPAMDIISNFGNHELNVKELGGNQIILRFSEPLLPTISDIVEDLEKRLPRQGGERAVMFQEVIELLSKGVVTESEENDWDFLDDDPLEFVGGEIYIDIKNLSYDQRIEMFNKLENDIGELNVQEGGIDDTRGERIEKCFNLSRNGILLHCGHEDNEFNPKKNDVCCMTDVSFEELASDTHDYHSGGLTYVNGEDLIDTQPIREDRDFSRDIGTPEELKVFLLINQEDIVDWVEEGIEEYPPGEIGEEDIKQWLRDFSGEITPGRFLLTYDDFTHGDYNEDMFRNVYKEFVEETYNKFFGVTDILGKLDGLKEDEDGMDWMRDIPEEPLMNSEFDISDPEELLRALIDAMDELEMEDLDGLSEKGWKKLIKVVLKTEEFRWFEEKDKFLKLPWNLQASNLKTALFYL